MSDIIMYYALKCMLISWLCKEQDLTLSEEQEEEFKNNLKFVLNSMYGKENNCEE